jgi:hypothetical protein
MGKGMKRFFPIAVLLCSVFVFSRSDGGVVSGVFGLNVDCGDACKPIPLNASILCDGSAAQLNCPQYFAPDFSDPDKRTFYGVTNVFNPARLVISTDGGVTWGDAASVGRTYPFSTATYSSQGVSFSVAANGALIAAGNVDNNANACVIRRSVDGGVSWTTVHTLSIATGSCGAWNTTALSSLVKCAVSGVRCTVLGSDGLFPLPIVSEDYGATWVVGSLLNTVIPGAPPFQGIGYDGSGLLGIAGGTGVNDTRRVAYTESGSTWLASGLWGVTTSFGTMRCTGIVENNLRSSPSVVCGPGNLLPTTYAFFEIVSGVPTFIRSFTMSDALAFSNSPDIKAIQWDTTTYYLMQRNLAATRTNFYVTKDNFISVNLIASLQPINQFPACCRGDMYKWNGSIYATSGGAGGSAQFFRIQ